MRYADDAALLCGVATELPPPQKYPALQLPLGDSKPGDPQYLPAVHGVQSDDFVRFCFAPYVPFGHKNCVPNRVPEGQ